MSDSAASDLQARIDEFLPGTIGLRITGAAPDRVTAEIHVSRGLCTVPGVMHGGAVMALADTLGGVATMLNLQPGYGTTTIESKTNFFASGLGPYITGICIPLHIGRTTSVWQTTVQNVEGRTIAIVTQTQMSLPAR